jgi:hypothetical protein
MSKDQRLSERKVLRVRARLTLDGADPVWIQTADIGKFGMGLARIPQAVPANAQGVVQFELTLDGQIRSVSMRVRVAYCIPVDAEFKAGVQFLDLQSPEALLVAQYVEG